MAEAKTHNYAEEYEQLKRQLAEKDKELAASEEKLKRLKASYYAMKNSKIFSLLHKAKQMKVLIIDVIRVLRGKKKIRAFFQKGIRRQSGTKRMETYCYYLYELGFTERVLADLKEIYTTSGDQHMKRLAALELSRWYASKKTDSGAKRALSYLPAAVKGKSDPDLLRQAAITTAESLHLLNHKQKAKQVLQKALAVWDYPELHKALAILEEGKEKQQSSLLPEEQVNADVVFATDFRLPDKELEDTIEEIHINQARGLKTGLVSLATYDFRKPPTIINPAIQKLIDKEVVELVDSDQQVNCNLLIIKHPQVLEEKQEQLPRIVANMVRVVMDTTPGGQHGYSLRRSSRNLLDYADKQARWHPRNEQVRSLLTDGENRELKYIKLASQDWYSSNGSNYEAFLDDWLIKQPRGDVKTDDGQS
ncbi:hypothetical protein GCM10007216_15220 [Thalassobacillus devorans]|uniref:Uncharacterized protein n=1 Tax=Thalassobacillus devorans TaxID=279813 RepID=A0ABQ1NWE1_9BACI|nr:hypothetical protein [Thalassobacillus devorans]NIK28535.1 hypothetical protein [Thalassobacillus devorans]GGC85452.1 hypothetical protein GCM10007216_15220 [Thalassobacillus devorans]